MRELRPLTPDRVVDLVGSCAPCTFWLTVPRSQPSAGVQAGPLLAAWVEQVTADWAPPGQVAYVEGRPVGHFIMAPARFLPRLAAFATNPCDPSALMLATVVTAAEADDPAVFKQLVQAAAKQALRQAARTLDTVAARPLAVGRHPCVLEVGPLEGMGFRVERDHYAYPRLRLDLRTTLSIRDDAAAYLSWARGHFSGLRSAPVSRPDGAARAADHREPRLPAPS